MCCVCRELKQGGMIVTYHGISGKAPPRGNIQVDVSDNKEQIMIWEEECGGQTSEPVPKL